MVSRSTGLSIGAAMVAAGSLSACATGPGSPAPVEFRNGMGDASYGELGVLTPSELNGPIDPRSLPDTVMVEPGQTLFDISRRYQTPLDAIIAENRLRPPYALEKGQLLRLPDANVYTVRRGETFWTVAEKFSIDPHSFATLNRLNKPYFLIEGQEVVLPAGATAKNAYVRRAPATKAKPGARIASAPPPPSVSQAPIDTPAGRFIWPVSGKMLQGFGPMANGQRSDGLKIAAPEGAPIRAADAGSVVYAGDDLPGYGNLVLVKHDGGWITAYANARRILVKEGAKVAKGDVIAEVGATGRAKQAGLHFELRKGPRPVDPLPALPRA